MKICVMQKVVTPVEYEVEVPFYGVHRLEDSTTHFRMEAFLDGRLKRTSITEGSEGFELSVDFYQSGEVFDASGPDYWLGRGLHESNQRSYDGAVARLRAALAP